MSDPFLAEIRIFPLNFAPRQWAFCGGQLMPISQNTALFSLLGVTYGGNGQSIFGLPDLRGAVAVGAGQAAGLSSYDLGQMGGAPTDTLTTNTIPLHNHLVTTTSAVGTVTASTGNQMAKGQSGNVVVGLSQAKMYSTGATTTTLSPQNAVQPLGGNQPHNNMMPFLGLNFCIALSGAFPPRP